MGWRGTGTSGRTSRLLAGPGPLRSSPMHGAASQRPPRSAAVRASPPKPQAPPPLARCCRRWAPRRRAPRRVAVPATSAVALAASWLSGWARVRSGRWQATLASMRRTALAASRAPLLAAEQSTQMLPVVPRPATFQSRGPTLPKKRTMKWLAPSSGSWRQFKLTSSITSTVTSRSWPLVLLARPLARHRSCRGRQPWPPRRRRRRRRSPGSRSSSRQEPGVTRTTSRPYWWTSPRSCPAAFRRRQAPRDCSQRHY
mmetsp:Transcript_102755/g.266152  ORF Transcript_102755/g.266152 Transcript_102755/m.266152 type:complete len:256 (-) Transcript_102755:816-1583(-)